MSIEKKHGGNITVETAELIKELKKEAEKPSSGANGFTRMVLFETNNIITDYDMSELLPSDAESFLAETLTADLGLAFAAAIEDGAKFYYDDNSTGISALETTINYSTENPEVPVSISFVTVDESIDETWSAEADSSYPCFCYVFGDEMDMQYFEFETQPIE